jgi:hypothetical protein
MQAEDGFYGIAISADGRYVVFRSNATNLVPEDTNGVMDVIVHDRQMDQTKRIPVNSDGTQGNEASGFTLIAPNGIDLAYRPLITSDGRSIAFMSNASELVAGDTNSNQDIYI